MHEQIIIAAAVMAVLIVSVVLLFATYRFYIHWEKFVSFYAKKAEEKKLEISKDVKRMISYRDF